MASPIICCTSMGFAAGVVEAKKQGVTLTEVENQTDRYGNGLPVGPPGRGGRFAAAEQLTALKFTQSVINVTGFRAEGLRQSIIEAAFDGKLVPQDPKDEPASVLLERIRAEATPRKARYPGRKKISV
jgi:hypothetical protein